MGAIGNCCCGGIDCSDRSALPNTFSIDFGASLGTTTINRADWSGSIGIASYCCWSYTITHNRTIAFAIRDYKCSSEIPYSYAQGQKLVSYRFRTQTIIRVSTGSSQCDAQTVPTNQYVVTILDEYAGRVGVAIYDYPSPSCAALSLGLDGIFGFGISFSQSIMRAKYFASLAAGTYTLAATDLAECVPTCAAIDTSENSLTLTDIPTGLSVTWDDPNNWYFVTT